MSIAWEVCKGMYTGGRQGSRGWCSIRNSSQEMAINSYVCCSDTLQTVLMTPSPRRVANYFQAMQRGRGNLTAPAPGPRGTGQGLLLLTRQAGRGAFRFIRLIGCNGSSRNFQVDATSGDSTTTLLNFKLNCAEDHRQLLPLPPPHSPYTYRILVVLVVQSMSSCLSLLPVELCVILLARQPANRWNG